MIDYNIVVEEFKKFLEKFDAKDPKIAMKIRHSYHVADLAGKLGKILELTEEDILLSKTIGLFHDIGRFFQYEKYSDCKSKIDHASVGIEYLFENEHINDFKIPKRYYPIIEKAILNHNKLKIEDDLVDKELFFAKFLRDVDKIDILRQNITLAESRSYSVPLTNSVKKSFYEHHLVDKKEIQNQSDTIVVEIAYVFDIEFKESYELLMETDNLELYLSVIDVTKEQEQEWEAIKKEIRNYLEERIRE